MLRRIASKKTPAIWKRKPVRTNLISPADAMMTPITMKETLPRVLRFGGARPKSQLVRRTATGVVAWLQRVRCDIRRNYVSLWLTLSI
jgi:hypothetical protein